MRTAIHPGEHVFTRAEFQRIAEARYEAIQATAKTVSLGDMRRYLEARVAGKKTRKPVARRIAR